MYPRNPAATAPTPAPEVLAPALVAKAQPPVLARRSITPAPKLATGSDRKAA
jgi:hypothetical protein